jgi:hypothetical protein
MPWFLCIQPVSASYKEITMRTMLSSLVLVLAFTTIDTPAFAQRETATGIDIDRDVSLLRRDLRANKKKLIALNLSLTEEEATKFWPVYDQYAAEMARHYDEFYALIKDYVANQKTLTDTQASTMMKKWADIQLRQAQTRQKYIPLVEKAIPGRKAALFFQIDRRLYALMDMQVTSELPLIVD